MPKMFSPEGEAKMIVGDVLQHHVGVVLIKTVERDGQREIAFDDDLYEQRKDETLGNLGADSLDCTEMAMELEDQIVRLPRIIAIESLLERANVHPAIPEGSITVAITIQKMVEIVAEELQALLGTSEPLKPKPPKPPKSPEPPSPPDPPKA